MDRERKMFNWMSKVWTGQNDLCGSAGARGLESRRGEVEIKSEWTLYTYFIFYYPKILESFFVHMVVVCFVL